MRSVSCSIVSSSVAPGHAAWTTIVRKVKTGSSARPSRMKAMPPAIIAAIIR
jgi:hypothetical protein